MNTNTLNVDITSNNIIQLILLIFLAGLTRFALAAELRIEPSAPIIAVGESIPLTVLGASGKIMWLPPQVGEIQEPTQTHATYVAPNKVGQYYVKVLEKNGANKPRLTGIQVTVLPNEATKRAFSREKSVWEVFTNRNNVSALALSENGDILWIGTHGGLEKRDASNGQLIQLFTNLDGLPGNFVNAIANDGNGGLWVGTMLNGLAYKNNYDEFKVFNVENSDLPDNVINALVSDGNGGVWIATGTPFNTEKFSRSHFMQALFGDSNNLYEELFQKRNVLRQLEGFFGSNSGNPSSNSFDNDKDLLDKFLNLNGGIINKLLFGKANMGQVLIEGLISLLDCSKNDPVLELLLGDLLSGSEGGLVHLSKEGHWTIFNSENSHLPTDIIIDLISDGKGGLWIGTYCGGVVHFSESHEWTLYNMTNSGLHSNLINSLYQDDNDGLWVTTAFHGIIYRNRFGQWQVYNKANAGLPSNTLTNPISDGNGGIWVGAGFVLEKEGGLVHIERNGEVTVFNTANSELSEDTVINLANDGRGGLWIGTYGAGLVHRSRHGDWTMLNKVELKPQNRAYLGLPDNRTRAVVEDGNGGVWIGTHSFIYGSGFANYGGLAHLNSRGEWTIYNVENSGLPENYIWALAKDDNNGLWIGTIGGGLAHLSNLGQWTIYNTKNSRLPHNDIVTLLNDGEGGVWIGTAEGLAHWNGSGKWAIYHTYNSGLPDNTIGVLLEDSKGGLWIGTNHGLAHWNRLHNTWKVYNTSNSPLPHNLVAALLSDGNDGLWIATGVGDKGGLVHLSRDGQWNIYNSANSKLPSNTILSLANDGSGGVWIGTLKGLVHRSLRGDWTLFNTINAGLQHNRVMALANDGSNGVWILGWGLTHLTFSQRPFLCEKVPGITDKQCASLLKGKRTAIIIHSDTRDSGYAQDIAVDNIATHIYQTLFLRGYDHDEIYYLAYKPNLDFNDDGIADFDVVDAPITLQDFVNNKKTLEPITLKHLEEAFEWAIKRHYIYKAEGVPEEPLIVIFVTGSLPNKLVLSPGGNRLEKSQFKTLLDKYQTETGNKVVVIIEACYAGTLVVPPLLQEAPNRLVITSTDEKCAYYKDSGRISFSKFYFDQLHRGTDYWNAWRFVKDDIFAQLDSPFNQQHPQLKVKQGTDGKIADFCLNQCYGSLPEPELMPETPPRLVSSKDSIELAVKIKENGNEILSVSVSVITPQEANEYNAQGFELNKSFVIENLIEGNNGRWFTRFNDFTKPGKYNFIFRAVYKVRSGKRTVSALKPVTVSFKP